MTAVAPGQRFTKNNPCPICGGYEELPQGQELRCWGFLSEDGAYAHCTREQYRGAIMPGSNGAYAHRLTGRCNCGTEHGPAPAPSGEPVAIYRYGDFEKGRFEADGRKWFSWRAVGVQGWPKGASGAVMAAMPLYGSDQHSDGAVYFCEGENAQRALSSRGLQAVTNAGGAHQKDFGAALELLRGHDVVLWPDNDDDGRGLMDRLEVKLRPIAASVRRINWKEAGPKEDAVDYFRRGGTVDGIEALIEQPAASTSQRFNARLKPGSAILDTLTEAVALWGEGDNMLAVEGEPTMIYGPTGTGKSTIGQQLVLASIGAHEPALLGLPVAKRNRWLYLALDRPAQIKRSFRRMVSEDDRSRLDETLVLHMGPLVFDLAQEPERLLQMAQEVDADAVMIDSLKDAANDIEKANGGQGINRALQLLVSNGIDVVVLHHPRKAQADNKKPDKIDDVYGSRFIVDGMGSVILIWGEPGDGVVELRHLKQPRDVVGPWTIVHDHDRGTTAREDDIDAYTLIRASNGISAVGLARLLFKTETPTRGQEMSARRKAMAVVNRGLAYEQPGSKGGAGGSSPALFFLVSQEHKQEHQEHAKNTNEYAKNTGDFSESESKNGNKNAKNATKNDSGALFRESPDVGQKYCPDCGTSISPYQECCRSCVSDRERQRQAAEETR